MRILLTNDDGIRAPGLAALRDALAAVGEVVVAAPAEQMSAVSHSITLHQPIRLRTYTERGVVHHAVEGTPADAVKLAVRELLAKRPDVVVSGINRGLNTATNVLYSGTVAGAMEAAQWGIPAAAVSLENSDQPDFESAARRVKDLLLDLMGSHVRPGTVFNVNLPRRRPKGILLTRQGGEPYDDRFDRREDPHGRPYFWLLGQPPAAANGLRTHAAEVPTDAAAVAHGYISVTPLRRDMTCPDTLEALMKEWKGR